MIAALYVEKNGVYSNLPGVDLWDQERGARKYDGPYPVIAHPPCQRWGKMWMGRPSYVAETGIRKKKGDDGGCFKAALKATRKWGGIIEHPHGSHAWAHFGLNKPPRKGDWIKADDFGGWTCCVEQGQYGHYARKPTWLLVYGLDEDQLPELKWGHSQAKFPQWALKRYGREYCVKAGELAFKGGGKDSAPRINTPIPFRDLLIKIVMTISPQQSEARDD